MYLQRHADAARHLPDHAGGDGGGSIALVAVELDDWALKAESASVKAAPIGR